MQIKILRRRYSLLELRILIKSIAKLIFSPQKVLNFLLVKISLFLKMENCLGLPFNINIEPTANCNYKCVKCERFSDSYRDDGQMFEDKSLPFEHYRKILDDIGNILLSVRLWHFGEPLLNRNIIRMIEYAKKKNIIVAISSNLSLLSCQGAKDLVRSGLDYLVVSFDGATAKTYSRYHGMDYFDRVVENIKTLVSVKSKLKSLTPFIELQFIVMRDNEAEIALLKKLSTSLGVNKVTYLKLDKDKINLGNFKLSSFVDLLPKNKDFILDKDAIQKISLCHIPWEGALIRYSGVVLPCVEDTGQSYSMGRVFHNERYGGFKQIWKSDAYRAFRRNIIDNINDIQICARCAQRDNNIEDQIPLC